MKKVKKALALLLVLIMALSTTISSLAATPATTSNDGDSFYKIVHVDAGRKYFSPDSIKAIIDNAAEAGFNQVELYLSDNQGFRFALDDMTITTTYGTYDLTAALGDGYTQSDGKTPDGSGKYLTQSEMTGIIAYAKTKGIEIVPCINVPGHMGAILEEYTDFCYTKDGSTSKSSIDLNNEEAVAFALALTEKYVKYFAGQGLNYYNVGADEYANDLSSMGFEGMGSELYTKFVEFLNDAADIIIAAGMTPRAFNDGFYYKDYSISVTPNTAYEICYWSSGWSGYDVAAASTIAANGHKMINTHGDYYWVLGNSSWQCSAEKASQFDYKTFQGSTISEPAGAMFCIWCDIADTDGVDDGVGVVADTADVIAAFGATLPETETIAQSTVSNEDGTVSVTAPGLTSLTCTKVTAPEIEGADNVLAYDVVPMVGTEKYMDAATVSVKIPEGWNTDRLGAFIVETDGTITKLSGTYTGEVYTYVAPHFSTTGVYDTTETITVTVGQTTTITLEGDYTEVIDKNDLSTSVADVDAVYTQIEGSSSLKKAESITSDSSYYICDGNGNYLTLGNGNTLTTVTDVNDATKWIFTSYGNGYIISANGYYLRWGNNSLSVNTNNFTTWYYGDSGLYRTGGGGGARYLTYDDNTWTTSQNTTNYALPYILETTEPVNATTITFTGVSVGTTSVIVGNTKYIINVVAEDLSKVEPLEVEFWITNNQVTANGSTSMEINATASGIYSEKGVMIADLVPATGTMGDTDVAYWKATQLNSNHKQTGDSGVNQTLNGTDFTYIRYYNGSWAYSTNGNIWTNIVSGDQIVAYFLQVTKVTDEITTQVVDWGELYGNSYNDTNYVLVDYAVKYESGERVPDAFPINNVTQKFHCSSDNTNISYGNVVLDSNTDVYYRNLWSIRAVETSEYEVYMITLTPTADSATEYLAEGADAESTGQSDFYAGTEKVVWVNDEANLGEFADESLHYTSISGDVKYTVGGEPTISELEIYNRHGMLVTYYVRAKATEDALTVHYIDQTEGANNLEFYNYNIAVKEGIVFDENIALNTSNPNSDLINGTVTNYYNKEQTVSADLSTLSQIGAQYLYSEYECVRVERSADGKDVYLYYTFDPTVYFMADFGLPLDITASDLSDKLKDVTITDIKFTGVSTTSYGKLTDNGTTITYTPSKTFAGIDFFTLIVETDSEVSDILDSASKQIAFRVYVIPATTVYYEEGFAAMDGFTAGDAGTVKQDAELVGAKENVYGYDDVYASIGASNGTQATSTNYGDKAIFTFTGTGVDIYTNSTPETGTLFIQVKNSSGATVKMIQVKTALTDGNTAATTGQNVTGYNVPVASIELTDSDTYTVSITHVKPSSTATGDTVNLDGFKVYGTLTQDFVAYQRDGEANPEFVELRDKVLAALSVDTNTSEYADQIAKDVLAQVYSTENGSNGAVIIDATGNTTDVQDLLDNGPKNELYLYPQQSVVFSISGASAAHVGLKALDQSVTYTITGKDDPQTLATSTDMFYELDITKGAITITNKSGGILSITEIKALPGETSETVEFMALNEADIMPALMSLGFEAEPVEPVYADATLNIAVNDADGNILATTQLTANGVEGETVTFAAADIQAAVEVLELPDKYELEDVTYSDVTVVYGEDDSIVFTAEKELTTAEKVETIVNKIFAAVTNFFKKFFRW